MASIMDLAVTVAAEVRPWTKRSARSGPAPTWAGTRGCSHVPTTPCSRATGRRWIRGASWRARGSGSAPRASTRTGANPRAAGRDAGRAAPHDVAAAGVLPELRAALTAVAEDARHVMVVTDADGVLLWREGSTRVRHRADALGFTEGARWTRVPSAPTRSAPRWPRTRRCRSSRPSTSCAPTTAGPAPPAPCTTRAAASCSASSTSAGPPRPCTPRPSRSSGPR